MLSPSRTTPASRPQAQPARDSGGRTWLFAGTLLVLGLTLRLPRLLDSIWFDEAFRSLLMLRPERIRDLLLHDVHNPLYNAFMYGWVRVFGDREISIRTPSLLAGLGIIFVLFRWVRTRWGNRAAWWVAAFLALNPVHLWYSTEAKNNIFAVLFTALTLWRLDSVDLTPTRRNVALAALAGTLALWTDFQCLLVLPVAWLGWVVVCSHNPLRPGRRRAMLLSALGALSLALPLLIFKAANLEDLDRDYLRYFRFHEPIRWLFAWFITGNALLNLGQGAWPLVALATAPLALPALAAGCHRLRSTPAGVIAIAACFAPFVVFFLASEASTYLSRSTRLYQERNLLVILPGLSVVLAVGAASVQSRIGMIAARWGLLAISLASSLAIGTWSRDRDTVMYPSPDWRGAGAWIAAQSTPHPTAPLVLSRTPLLPLRYYLPHAAAIDLPPNLDLFESLAPHLPHNAPVPTEFYLIHSPYWSPIEPGALEALSLRFQVIDSFAVRDLSVLHLRTK